MQQSIADISSCNPLVAFKRLYLARDAPWFQLDAESDQRRARRQPQPRSSDKRNFKLQSSRHVEIFHDKLNASARADSQQTRVMMSHIHERPDRYVLYDLALLLVAFCGILFSYFPAPRDIADSASNRRRHAVASVSAILHNGQQITLSVAPSIIQVRMGGAPMTELNLHACIGSIFLRQ